MPKRKLPVIFDTSFILTSIRHKIHPFDDLEKLLTRRIDPVILSLVLREVRTLAFKGQASVRLPSKLALELLRGRPILETRVTGDVDEIILRLAKNLNAVVATADRGLLKKLKEAGVPRVYVRKRKMLALEGFVE